MKYTIGQKIYYTGDMANREGMFEIVSAENSRYGGNQYNLKEIKGDRMFRGTWETSIGDKHNGTCNPRFVTAEAYQAWREAQYEALQRHIEEIRAKRATPIAE